MNEQTEFTQVRLLDRTDELNKLEFKILNYLETHGISDFSELHSKFPHIVDLNYRLNILHKSRYIDGTYERTSSGTIKYLGQFSINHHGKRELQNYRVKKRYDFQQFIYKSVLIPIALTIITYILTNVLAATLIPSIIKWLLH